MDRAPERLPILDRHPWIVPLLLVSGAAMLGLLDALRPEQASLPGLLARVAVYAALALAGAAWVVAVARRGRVEVAPPVSQAAAVPAQPAPAIHSTTIPIVAEPAMCAHCAIREQNIALRRANAQLRELDQLRSDLVSMVSHDLRAPLTNISGSLELLEGECENPDCQCQVLLPIVGSQTARLTRLVHGLLNVTRIEAGRLQIHRKPILVSALAHQAILATQAGSAAHRFEIRVPADLPLVWGDEDRLEEVLVNLLDNAVKYSPDGGTISVEAQAGDGEVVVSVTDPGVGIPPDDLESIFEKYHRSNGSTEVGGHGLGLYICQKLVEAHGGRIWAESRPGAGSTFRFSLPAGVPEKTVGAKYHG